MSSQDTPLISVIMANYNGIAHIGDAIRSVLAQSVRSLEVIVSDDASTDNSCAMVSAMAQDPRVRLIRAEVNGGPGAARNRALDVARGRWVAIVDADDMLHPDRFGHLIAACERMGTDGVADNLTPFQDDAGKPARPLFEITGTTQIDAVAMMRSDLTKASLGYIKPVLRRAAIGNLRYREDIRVGEDHDFYMRYLLQGHSLHLLEQSYYLYRRHEGSISHRLDRRALDGMLRAQNDLVAAFPQMAAAVMQEIAARRVRLEQQMVFEVLVGKIKERRLMESARMLSNNRYLWPKLKVAAGEHFAKRLAGLGQTGQRRAQGFNGPLRTSPEG